VGFVRYADDTIMWSDDYGRLGAAVDALAEAARLIGADLNLDKSEGVRLLVHPGAPAEIERAERVEFVGYSLGLGVSEMKQRSVDRVKVHLEALLFSNLLREPLSGTQEPTRLAGHLDKDYWVFLLQARRYLYGDLSEAQLRRYQDRGVPLRRFKGLMSFYPLIDDSDVLRDLDAWLAARAWLTMRRRAQLLRATGYSNLPAPHDLPIDQFVRYRRKSTTTGEMADLRLPSFRRIANVVRAGARRHGPNQVGRGGRSYSY
jgi:hypothetical protein